MVSVSARPWALPEVDNKIARVIREGGDWEPEVGAAIRQFANRDWLFLDLGAHVGWFTRMASECYGQVIAVEPSLLHGYLVANNPGVETHNVAVTDKNEMVNLWPVIPNTGSTWVSHAAKEGSISVRSRTLVTILGDRRPEIIKADIEGCEYLAFKGNDVLDECEVLITEYSTSQLERSSGVTGRDYYDLVCEAGLSWFRLDGTPVEFAQMSTDGYDNYLCRRVE